MLEIKRTVLLIEHGTGTFGASPPPADIDGDQFARKLKMMASGA